MTRWRLRCALALPGLAAVLVAVLFLRPGAGAAAEALPEVVLPQTGLQPRHLGVVANKLDPESVRIGKYYVRARGVPEENFIQVGFSAKGNKMDPGDFRKLRERLLAKTPPQVEAYLLTWDKPYLVDCMSLASAVSFGYSQAYCAKGCKKTKASPYFNSQAELPYTDLGFRPVMTLPLSFDQAKRLIDKSIRGDASWPGGTAYLVETSDKARSVRKVLFPAVQRAFGRQVRVRSLKADALENKSDVLFYFTGRAQLEGLASNTYLPGAAADSLTSGSCIPGPRPKPGQAPHRHTDCRDFLEAGATGSYGTAIEPCNFLGKFSNPGILMQNYLRGQTLLEAYWKSVQMPGQGIFTGDPLARPFGGYRIRQKGDEFFITTRGLKPGWYDVLARTADGQTSVVYPACLVSGYPQLIRVPAVKAEALIVQPATSTKQ